MRACCGEDLIEDERLYLCLARGDELRELGGGEDADLFDDRGEVVLDAGDDARELVKRILALALRVGVEQLDGLELVFISWGCVDDERGRWEVVIKVSADALVEALGEGLKP